MLLGAFRYAANFWRVSRTKNHFSLSQLIAGRLAHTLIPMAALLAALELAWPWLTLASLMIFQISMRRRGVRNAHLLRCAFYCIDAALWLNLCLLLAAGIAVFYGLATHNLRTAAILRPRTVPLCLFWSCLLLWLIICYRLYVSYKNYLRFDHALATIIASQVIVALAIPTALVLLGLF